MKYLAFFNILLFLILNLLVRYKNKTLINFPLKILGYASIILQLVIALWVVVREREFDSSNFKMNFFFLILISFNLAFLGLFLKFFIAKFFSQERQERMVYFQELTQIFFITLYQDLCEKSKFFTLLSKIFTQYSCYFCLLLLRNPYLWYVCAFYLPRIFFYIFFFLEIASGNFSLCFYYFGLMTLIPRILNFLLYVAKNSNASSGHKILAQEFQDFYFFSLEIDESTESFSALRKLVQANSSKFNLINESLIFTSRYKTYHYFYYVILPQHFAIFRAFDWLIITNCFCLSFSKLSLDVLTLVLFFINWTVISLWIRTQYVKKNLALEYFIIFNNNLNKFLKTFEPKIVPVENFPIKDFLYFPN